MIHRTPSPAPDTGRSEVRILLPASTAVRLVVTGVGLLVAINLIDAIQGVIIWSLAAIFLALALEPAIRLVERRGLSRRTATVTVYAITVLTVAVRRDRPRRSTRRIAGSSASARKMAASDQMITPWIASSG